MLDSIHHMTLKNDFILLGFCHMLDFKSVISLNLLWKQYARKKNTCKYFSLLINYSIYSTYTAKCVGVILVTFLLSYSHLGLYGLHLGLYGLHLGLYGCHLGLYRNPCIWLVRGSVSSVTWERSSWEFIKGGPIFHFGKKCRNRNTTTATPTFFELGTFWLGDVSTVHSVNQFRPCCREDFQTELSEMARTSWMRSLADDLSRYELLTPEKTESVLEEKRDTLGLQFNCH